MMITVGAFEAKTLLSQLLERVSEGEEIIITKRGKSIARLVPERDAQEREVSETIDRIKQLQEEVDVAGDEWKEWREKLTKSAAIEQLPITIH